MASKGPDAERQRQVLAHLAQGWLPFHESNNSQLIPIRQLSLAKEKMTIESSQTYHRKRNKRNWRPSTRNWLIFNGKQSNFEVAQQEASGFCILMLFVLQVLHG